MAASCAWKVPCSGCGLGEGQQQALFRQAGSPLANTSSNVLFSLLPGCLTISILEACLPSAKSSSQRSMGSQTITGAGVVKTMTFTTGK